MKKNMVKIALDTIMAAILILLYNSHAISLAFHEIAGLIIFGMFVIHCLLNVRWIKSITKKFFGKSLAPRVRLGYIVDLLLLISFVLVIISGISTSQVLFAPIAQAKDSPWRSVHHFFAAFALILVGVHIGLHWSFVCGMFKKTVQIPQKVAKPLGVGLLVVLLAFGTFSIATSRLIGWLAEPFWAIGESRTSDSGTGSAKNEDKSSWDGTINDAKPGESRTSTTESSPSSTPSASVTGIAKTEGKSSWDGIINGDKPGEDRASVENSSALTEEKEEMDRTEDETGTSDETNVGTTVEPTEPKAEGEKSGDTTVHPVGEKKSDEGSAQAIVGTIVAFLSIMSVFSVITYYLNKVLGKKKKTPTT